MSIESQAFTFIGPDGSGKSTIAYQFADIVRERGGEPVMIGSSSYRNWVTPEIAERHWGDSGIFAAEPVTFAEKTSLYEAIAVTCYGHMDQLRSQGKVPIIDSDPFFKRLVWAHLQLDPSEVEDYCRRFETLVESMIGSTFPDHFINVSLGSQDRSDEAAGQDAYNRLLSRGLITEYDPNSVDQSTRLVRTVDTVWQRVLGYNYFQDGNVNIHYMENGFRQGDDLSAHTGALALNLAETVMSMTN